MAVRSSFCLVPAAIYFAMSKVLAIELVLDENVLDGARCDEELGGRLGNDDGAEEPQGLAYVLLALREFLEPLEKRVVEPPARWPEGIDDGKIADDHAAQLAVGLLGRDVIARRGMAGCLAPRLMLTPTLGIDVAIGPYKVFALHTGDVVIELRHKFYVIETKIRKLRRLTKFA